MGYPPQYPPPGYPQPGYPQQAPQPYQPQPGYPQPYQPQGYTQQPYQPQAAAGGGYDFGQLYGMADHSTGVLYDEGWYSAVVEDASYGRTKDGTKGSWTIKFRTTSGVNAGRSPVTMTLSISPVKKDGTSNEQGMGIMFRHLRAMGVPTGPPLGPPEEQPFWAIGWNEEMVAQQIKGKPCEIKLMHDEYDGVTRSKVRDIRPPKPGAPVDWPRGGQQQPGAMPAVPPGMLPGGQPPAVYPGQPGQPYQPQMPYPQAGPTAPPGQPAPPAAPQPSPAPPWAQPAVPGQGGLAEFTPQGMSAQPSIGAYPQPPQDQQTPGVPQPPWAQQPPQQAQGQQPPLPFPQQPQAPWNGQPQVQQDQQPQQPGAVPPAPPWAQ